MTCRSRAKWLASQERWHARKILHYGGGQPCMCRICKWHYSQSRHYSAQLAALSVKGK